MPREPDIRRSLNPGLQPLPDSFVSWVRGERKPLGPAFETFLTVLVPVALALGLLAYLSRGHWARLAQAMSGWKERDELDEKAEAQAKQEIAGWNPEGSLHEKD